MFVDFWGRRQDGQSEGQRSKPVESVVYGAKFGSPAQWGKSLEFRIRESHNLINDFPKDHWVCTGGFARDSRRVGRMENR